jgi:hypothetical protein
MRMTEKRGGSRGAHTHGAAQSQHQHQYAALNERALRLANGTDKGLARELLHVPVADVVVNRTVSFASAGVKVSAPHAEASQSMRDDQVNEVKGEDSTRPSHHLPVPAAPHPTANPTAPSWQQQKHIEAMIQREVEAAKDIDKKTIKCLSEEIRKLTNILKERDVMIASRAGAGAGTGPPQHDPTPVRHYATTPVSSSRGGTETEELVHISPLSGKEARTPLSSSSSSLAGEGGGDSKNRKISASALSQKRKGSESKLSSAYQRHLLYSFLFGGIVVLIVSTCVSWIRGAVL